MNRWIIVALLTASALLTGCTTTVVRSNVTTFHEWPETLSAKTYVFERTVAQNNNLEYRNYEDLVRNEMNRLGFTEAAEGTKPVLKANLDYGTSARDVREVYAVPLDPWWPHPYRGYYSPLYSPFYSPFYGPFYDPFFYGPPVYEQREKHYVMHTRTLHVTLTRFADGKLLYDTRVISEGRNPSLATVMPYLVKSAFVNFPGKSGETRVEELRLEQ